MFVGEESALEIEKQRVGDMIYEILIDMIKRRKLYERLQSHLKSTRQLKRDIRLYLESLITRQKYLENYRHALRYGQSEQQNRRVVAMEARSSLRKVKFLGLITCCLYGKLTNPQLIEATNKDLVPDKIAKALGARSLVTGIMRTVTYRHLRDRHAIYMFRFGIQTMGNDGAEGGNKTIDLESLFKEDEETNATDGKKGEGSPNEGKKEQGNATAKKSIKGDVNSKFWFGRSNLIVTLALSTRLHTGRRSSTRCNNTRGDQKSREKEFNVPLCGKQYGMFQCLGVVQGNHSD